MQLEIQKRRCYLKNVALDFVFLVLKLCPSCYPTSIMDKNHHVLVIALFYATSAAFLGIGGIPVTNHLFIFILFYLFILSLMLTITEKILFTIKIAVKC